MEGTVNDQEQHLLVEGPLARRPESLLMPRAGALDLGDIQGDHDVADRTVEVRVIRRLGELWEGQHVCRLVDTPKTAVQGLALEIVGEQDGELRVSQSQGV